MKYISKNLAMGMVALRQSDYAESCSQQHVTLIQIYFWSTWNGGEQCFIKACWGTKTVSKHTASETS